MNGSTRADHNYITSSFQLADFHSRHTPRPPPPPPPQKKRKKKKNLRYLSSVLGLFHDLVGCCRHKSITAFTYTSTRTDPALQARSTLSFDVMAGTDNQSTQSSYRAEGRGKGRRQGRRQSAGETGAALPNAPSQQAVGVPSPEAQKVHTADDTDLCFICANPIKFTSITPCNHKSCHVCALRMRALYENKDCPHCRVR